MTRFQKALFSFLLVITCFLVAVILIGQGKWQKPLGPTLRIPTVTPFHLPATWTPRVSEVASTLVAPRALSTSAPKASPVPTGTASAGLCGGPAVMNILAIGADARGDNYTYGLADVIRIVRVDFANPKVTVLEIPRDLWVEIPDIADHLNGQDHEKLNQAYLYGNPGMGYTDDPAHGPGLLARTLTLNFGTQIDHYAAVNMRTFEKIVNAVGGLDVTLPKAVDGRTPDDMNDRLLFPAGRHHLTGAQALMLARIRIKGGFARAENQNRVLCALRDKLLSSAVVGDIPDLIGAFQGAILTDLSPEQLGQLACIGTRISSGNIVFASFPAEHFKQARKYDPVFKKNIAVWDVDFKILRDYISRFNDGTWPNSATARPMDTTEEEAAFCP